MGDGADPFLTFWSHSGILVGDFWFHGCCGLYLRPCSDWNPWPLISFWWFCDGYLAWKKNQAKYKAFWLKRNQVERER